MAAKRAFEKHGVEVNFIKKEYPEIQADTSLEIAASTAKTAAKELGIPVIREDHSFFVNALGIPGPYCNYFERALGTEGLLKMLKKFLDRSAYFEIATVYALPDGKIKTWVGRVPIIIACEPRGDLSRGWDAVLMFENEKRTFAEYPMEERIDVWNENFEKIAKLAAAGEL